MLTPLPIALLGLAYVGVLFVVAHLGDRRAAEGRGFTARPWVYSLSLAVYCTSWAFYGTGGQSAELGWWLPPTYVGTILLFLFGTRFLGKMIRLGRKQKITSIADFLAARYGRDRRVAILVTVVAVCGLTPYIALQLKAIDISFTAVSGLDAGAAAGSAVYVDTAIYVAIVLAAFAILFGTRHADATEHHPGMMLALAFESIVKLGAFLAVGAFITFGLFDGPADLAARVAADPQVRALREATRPAGHYLALTVLGVLAIFCLPRQFHVAVVENSGPRDLEVARWLFPLYLVAISVFVLPVANAGLAMFGAQAPDPDLFVLNLPLANGQPALALVTFIGGLSAATGMVIVACIALSTMICNEIAMPALLHLFPALRRRSDLTGLLLGVRRIVIVLLLAAAYVYYRSIAYAGALAAIGEIAMAAVALFGPLVFAALYWKRASASGALVALACGFAVWLYTLIVPVFAQAGYLPGEIVADGPFGIGWLRPTGLFGIVGVNPLAHGLAASLLATTIGLVAGSLATRRTLVDRIQAAAFVDAADGGSLDSGTQAGALTLKELHALVAQFVGTHRTEAHFAQFGPLAHRANAAQLESTRRLLGSVIGAASAHRVIDAAASGKELVLEDVVTIVDSASRALEFNRELLQATMENVSQGISVVDAELRLVAWNHRYLELFAYPPDLLYIGKPIEEVLEFNAARGELGEGDAAQLVARRMAHLRRGTNYAYERIARDGTVLEIRGNRMPGGGFVTSYTDVTGYKRTEAALEERVRERTRALSAMNEELAAAKSVAERANQGKTRFLAAASHDVLQPLNAAGLFAGALLQKLDRPEQKSLVGDIEQCLRSAEGVLTDLLDISKLDAGVVQPQIGDVAVQELFAAIEAEFALGARSRGLELRVRASRAIARSDAKLLRRVLQNFVANAIRYTGQGRVVVGCRRGGETWRIEVWDSGPGIAADQLERIFEEFYRTEAARAGDAVAGKGFGLGLAIADRIARRLGHRLLVRSWPGRGSMFAVEVPRGSAARPIGRAARPPRAAGSLHGVRVLVVDNDAAVLRAMIALLESWQCEVRAAAAEAELPDPADWCPDILIVDFHLDRGATGVALAARLRAAAGADLPLVVITADAADATREQVEAAGGIHLRKPVRPLALHSVLRRVVLQGPVQRSRESGAVS
ncbi:MAG: Sensor histidine kinase RcsC [Steroidobacteraceae bacterium]|nr:Sensor histidine kinase RcsC [Steroidobacteraceae bacterium]